MKQEFNRDKFQELILYIADRCMDDPNFGAVILNKILFYTDFLAFGQHGRSVTGATYVKRHLGPVPRELVGIRRDMEQSRDAVTVPVDRFGYIQKKLLPLRSAKLDVFEPYEVALVDRVVEVLRGHTAADISALSHLEYGWRVAYNEEEIPYEAVFLSDEPLTNADIARGLALASSHGWDVRK